ncbi:hypothetical protein GSI_05963 [Ganoderma sinense ZZ0214-1]|uniref:Transporter n=1 Tax=Ganoderma sinense ZZ0214-1 TaxID=1077348 RepID=A0A2G8SBW9_9APHY|nr:hypothetical protein GSI_05963 [Ganoderma sinense ZZ0214-1]
MSFLTVIGLIILPSLLFPYPVSSALVNRTIDDEYGDSVTGALPVFGPDASYWHQGSTCSACHITPFIDKTQPFDGTWHDGTYNPDGPDLTISFSFTGTAVYVYNIVPNTIESTDTLENITFTLDGSHAGTYVHNPDSTTVLLYRQVVYKSTNLDNKEHTVVMRSSGLNASLILFDYAVYTTERTGTSSSSTSSASSSATSSPSSSHSMPVGAIAGGIVGGIAFLAFLAIAGFCIQRRRHPKEPQPLSGHLEIKPFVEGADGSPYTPGAPYHGSEYGGSVSAGGGSGYGGASANGASPTPSPYGTTSRHAPRPSDAPTIPLLFASPDPSLQPRRRASDKREMVPLSARIQSQSPDGTPGADLARQNTSTSRHQAELTERIRALEDQMRGFAGSPPPPGSTAASDRSFRAASRSTSPGTGHADEVVRVLQGELAALRSEVAGLNAQLAEERMMGGGSRCRRIGRSRSRPDRSSELVDSGHLGRGI